MREAEGQSYDILNASLKDGATLTSIAEADTRSLNRFRNNLAFERKITIDEGNKAHIDDLRRINRISYHRWKDELDRGYDILSTKSNKTIIPRDQLRPSYNILSMTSSRPSTEQDSNVPCLPMNDSELSSYFERFVHRNHSGSDTLGTTRQDSKTHPTKTLNQSSSKNSQIFPRIDLMSSKSTHTVVPALDLSTISQI